MNKHTIGTPFTAQRNVITRVVMVHCLLCLLLRACAHTLPVQLSYPVLTKAGYNLTHILYNFTGLGSLLTQNYVVSLLFTFSLFAAALLLLVVPRKTWIAITFSALLLLLVVTTNVYVNFNQHYLFLLWIATLPFCVRTDTSFSLLWEGARYYACWVYGSTFILKLINGAMWQWDYGLMTMKEQVAEYIFLNPGTSLALFYTWLIQYGWLINIGQKLVFLAEGLFLLGFFTRKYDRLLICSGIFIFITTSLFANVFFIEQVIVLVLVFLSPGQWNYIQNRFRKAKPAIG